MEKKPSPEFQPFDRVTGSVRRYGLTLNALDDWVPDNDSTQKLSWHLEKYIQDELGLTDAESTKINEVIEALDIIPHAHEVKGEKCEVEERIYLAPLTLVAPFIEAKYFTGEYSLDEMSLWLKETTKISSAGVWGLHGSEQCLSGFWAKSRTDCEESSECPLKELRRYFTSDILSPAGTKLEETVAPSMFWALTREKVEIARQFDLISEGEYQKINTLYDLRINEQ